ncbi:uncharacterized protein LOC135945182 [Cloeon dipterum]|uniref:uncharacterized protein LOC135945182 n=1 Tax=Cloeon dipterum TaxID=197152 RepID=UPI0032202198
MKPLIMLSIFGVIMGLILVEAKPANNQLKPNITSSTQALSAKPKPNLTTKATSTKNATKPTRKSAAIQPLKSLKPANKPAAKAVAKTAVRKPAVKPASRSAPKTAAKQQVKPAAKQQVKPAAKQQAKPAVKQPAKLAVNAPVQKAARSGVVKPLWKSKNKSNGRKKPNVVAVIVEYDLPDKNFRKNGRKGKHSLMSKNMTKKASSTANTIQNIGLELSENKTTTKEPASTVSEYISVNKMINLEMTPAPSTEKNPLVTSYESNTSTLNVGPSAEEWNPWYVPPEELIKTTTRSVFDAYMDVDQMIRDAEYEFETTPPPNAEKEAFGGLVIGGMVGGFLGGFASNTMEVYEETTTESTPLPQATEHLDTEERFTVTEAEVETTTSQDQEKSAFGGLDIGSMIGGFLGGFKTENEQE